eukprot:192908-Hanusia_phi.AAC.5
MCDADVSGDSKGAKRRKCEEMDEEGATREEGAEEYTRLTLPLVKLPLTQEQTHRGARSTRLRVEGGLVGLRGADWRRGVCLDVYIDLSLVSIASFTLVFLPPPALLAGLLLIVCPVKLQC